MVKVAGNLHLRVINCWRHFWGCSAVTLLRTGHIKKGQSKLKSIQTTALAAAIAATLAGNIYAEDRYRDRRERSAGGKRNGARGIGRAGAAR